MSIFSCFIIHVCIFQVAFYEIVNGLWVRNGLQIKGQAMTYIQCNFCSSMVDADLFLLQILATQLPAVNFLTTTIEKCVTILRSNDIFVFPVELWNFADLQCFVLQISYIGMVELLQ